MSSKKDKPDEETSQLLDDGVELEAMARSKGWGIAKRMLHAKILDVGNILTIGKADGLDPTKLVIELAARQLAIEMVLGWQQEVEASVTQHIETSKQFHKIQEESHIFQVEDAEEDYEE